MNSSFFKKILEMKPYFKTEEPNALTMNVPELQKEDSSFTAEYGERNQRNFCKGVKSASSALCVQS